MLQLEHSYDPSEMYGDNYGYRSGLNPSMVQHLRANVELACRLADLRAGDVVVDIGSNDCTSLKAYPEIGLERVGVDPVGAKFKAFYPDSVRLLPDFFSGELLERVLEGRKAKVVTSFSMFYDLESPLDFMCEIRRVLTPDGVWLFEQSYLPAMLEANSFDTVCHEHLEYYALAPIAWMAERAGFVLEHVEFNDVNGGSFLVAARPAQGGAGHSPAVLKLLEAERALKLDCPETYVDFTRRIETCRDELRAFIAWARGQGLRVGALGASTKGNVLLQYYGLGPGEIECIGEVNPDKFGHVTPGTGIPIIPQVELIAREYDYLIVLPWHFRKFFEESKAFGRSKLVFPLPRLEVFSPD